MGVVALFLLTFLLHDEAFDTYDRYRAMEVDVKQAGQADSLDDSIDISPKDLKRAVKRSEKLWENNLKKRTAFIKEQGGLGKIREFADKAHGWGQSFTLVRDCEFSR